MSVLRDLREMEPRQWIAGIATILAMVGPGVLSIYHYLPDLFSNIDSVKLILLSGSITLPLAAFNFLVLVGVWERIETPFPVDGQWSISAAITSVILYIVLALAYVRDVSFGTFLRYALSGELIMLCLLAIPWTRNLIFVRSADTVEEGRSEEAA